MNSRVSFSSRSLICIVKGKYLADELNIIVKLFKNVFIWVYDSSKSVDMCVYWPCDIEWLMTEMVFVERRAPLLAREQPVSFDLRLFVLVSSSILPDCELVFYSLKSCASSLVI